MKALLFLACLFLLGSPAYSMIRFALCPPAKAKELGIRVEVKEYGEKAYWVNVRYRAVGALEKFRPEKSGRVTFKLMNDKTPEIMADLADRAKSPEKVEVAFMVPRSEVGRVKIWVAYGGGLLDGMAYELGLKDFLPE